MKELIEKTCNLLGRYLLMSSNITINLIEGSHYPIPLYGYADELTHAMVIVIKNTYDAILEYKKNHKELDGEIKFFIQYDLERIHLQIQDNGGGIPEDVFPLIFDPYFTTKKNGTGIGLVTAKMIIEDSWQGELNVKNHECGACFEFILPIEKNFPLNTTNSLQDTYGI